MNLGPNARRISYPLAAASTPLLLWLAQPPWAFWPLATISLLPWLWLASQPRLARRDYGLVWLCATLYWLLSLQGLRLAHPLMVLPWLMLGSYLAIYSVLFVAIVQRLSRQPNWWLVTLPVGWVGLECIRNYLFTGLSVLMLGHLWADLPALAQIADLFGSYGISFLIVMINVTLWQVVVCVNRRGLRLPAAIGGMATAAAVIATLAYGRYRGEQPLGKELATFALIQRSEPIEYGQPIEREMEIFQQYLQQATAAVAASERPVDAVVWPESMFTGGAPWRIVEQDFVVPADAAMERSEFLRQVEASRQYFLQRAAYIQDSLAARNLGRARPDLLGGCAVIRYADQPKVHSGFIHVGRDGRVADWYGKTHLVVFGEYFPVLPHLPLLRRLVPEGLGVSVGPGPQKFRVAGTSVAPNICIETAVERVTVNHLRSFWPESSAVAPTDAIPQVVVTVTNDGWFDDSSVIDHHLRCAQLLAIAVRRPILSAANNGPTAWIDSYGRVVDRLPQGSHGAVLATPRQDNRVSLYLRIGDWPARFCALAAVGMLLFQRKLSVGRFSFVLGRRSTPPIQR